MAWGPVLMDAEIVHQENNSRPLTAGEEEEEVPLGACGRAWRVGGGLAEGRTGGLALTSVLR